MTPLGSPRRGVPKMDDAPLPRPILKVIVTEIVSWKRPTVDDHGRGRWPRALAEVHAPGDARSVHSVEARLASHCCRIGSSHLVRLLLLHSGSRIYPTLPRA